MVEIKEFLPIHFDKLIELHEKQNSPITQFLTLDTLPQIGYIVTNATEYVAMGFLRRLEGGFAQLDTFATNPDSSPEDRNEALNLLTETLINRAKSLRLRGVYAMTQNDSIAMRAQQAGFSGTLQILLSKVFPD